MTERNHDASSRIYDAKPYAADGHGTIDTTSAVYAEYHGTYDEVIEDLCQSQYGGDHERMNSLRWVGDEGEVEAYHDSDAEGCGGWAITTGEKWTVEKTLDLFFLPPVPSE